MLKYGRYELIKPLTYLINKSIKEGVFPDCLKIAKIVPIHKKKDKRLVENYRPISLLPSISKIWEKVINDQLNIKLNELGLIPQTQYGFTKVKNTIHTIQHLLLEIEKAKTNKLVVAVVFIDVSKAFDCCNHGILLSKLEHLGMDINSLKLIKSYLTNRKQSVQIRLSKSSEITIELGVGQGTILGPTFFKIYVHDLPSITMLLSLLFADDTTIIITGLNAEDLNLKGNRELALIYEWFSDNGLTVHPDKSRLMVFGKDDNINLNIGGVPIIKCGDKHAEKSFNMLGITLDQKLSWKYQVENVIKKISKGSYLLFKHRKLLNLRGRLAIYNAFVRPHILYGISTWGGTKGPMMKKLKLKHKKIIRLLVRGKIHVDPILKKLRLLKIQDEHSLSLHQLGWEFLNNILPISIGNYITPKVNLAGTRNPSRVMEILPSYANGSYQIGSLLRKQINTLNLSEINLMNKKILRKSITTKILNTYHESVICFNRGCTECMV